MKNVMHLSNFMLLITCLFGFPLSAQDSIGFQANPDTLFAPEANGYILFPLFNDGCIQTLEGIALNCDPLSITSVDDSGAAGLGTVLWDNTTVSFEPNALFLALDTVISIPYSVVNGAMQTASSYILIAKGPGFPVPQTWCCPDDDCIGELICNPEFSLPVPCNTPYAASSYLDVDITLLAPCWQSIEGTPNGNWGILPGQGECGAIAMWAVPGGGEGLQTAVSVTAGQRYLFFYTGARGGTGNGLDNFYTGLTAGPINNIPFGPPTFLIHNQQNTVSTAKQQTVACFTPNANYNNLVLYPQQNGGSPLQPHILLYNVHLEAFPAPAFAVNTICGQAATLSVPASCIPGASWNWTNANGLPIASNTTSIQVIPTQQNQEYFANLTFPPGITQVNCNNLTVSFTVITQGDCCCDDFYNAFDNVGFTYTSGPSYHLCAPATIAPTDWLTWDFGDGNSAGPVIGAVPCVFHAYSAPGPYLATLTIQRVGLDGDTCKVELCELIDVVVTCDDCFQNLQQITTDIDLGVDMTSWTPAGGPVTFYPVPYFGPYNVRVLWDFDCDGNVDQTTTGNNPATATFLCGPQVVCYTVECLLTQQVGCDGVAFEEAFDLPCSMGGDFCCADFMTHALNYGIDQSLLGGNTYQFCVSPTLPTPYFVEWDVDCDGVDNTGTSNCANFQLTPGNTSICATIHYITPQGDTCRVTVKDCLPEITTEPDTCTCQNPMFQDAVNDGFTWFENPGLTGNFTPVSLIDDCDVVTWIWGDGSNPDNSLGNATITHIFPNVGIYTVCMIVTRMDPTGEVCDAEFCLTIDLDNMVAVVEINPGLQLTVQPNPTGGPVVVELPAGLAQSGHFLTIHNIQGQQLTQVEVTAAQIDLDLSSLAPGLYFLTLATAEGQFLCSPYKLVKE